MAARRSKIGALAIGLAALLSACALGRAEKNPPSKPIDLNVANVKELQELPGIGAATAQRIVDLRQKSGRFHRVEDLLAVRGISPKKLDAMRKYITVSAVPAPNPPAKKNTPPGKNGSPCTGCSTTNSK